MGFIGYIPSHNGLVSIKNTADLLLPSQHGGPGFPPNTQVFHHHYCSVSAKCSLITLYNLQ